MKLGALLPWDAGLFFPAYSARDRLVAYGMLGGIPAYLERFDPARDFRAQCDARRCSTRMDFFMMKYSFCCVWN